MLFTPNEDFSSPFADFEDHSGRDALGKGAFWLIKNERDRYELFCVKILCYRDGESLERVATGRCEAEGLGPKATWERVDPSITKNLPYGHYPRGRVKVKNGKAVIYLSKRISREDVIEKICQSFGLFKERGISSVRVKTRLLW